MLPLLLAPLASIVLDAASSPGVANGGRGVVVSVASRSTPSATRQSQAPLPEWARTKWDVLAKTRQLKRSAHHKTTLISGRFDTDTTTDIALLVEHRTTHKVGIAFIHRGATPVGVVGAGKDFGNGGDNFDWMDNWRLEPRTRTRAVDAVFVRKSESASALIYFVKGKYIWKQAGD